MNYKEFLAAFDNSKRLVCVRVSQPFLIYLFTKGNKTSAVECVEGLPEGAKFHNSYYEWESNSAYLVFSHESFAEVPDGEKLPILNIEHKEIL